MDYVAGYAVALDLTSRNIQTEAKAKGLPWTVAKGFDTSCPIGSFLEKDQVDPQDVTLVCAVNGQVRQRGNTKDMLFPVSVLISHISHKMSLSPADVILTGTPSGVGPVKPGDFIEISLEGVSRASFSVGEDA
mmetsp:Transcript_49470/g.127471  ORF Transcript_49470/g.127471 Transcript_49470/m.127471 type:complete len:133 (-) Transcript_49470:266-664(-)